MLTRTGTALALFALAACTPDPAPPPANDSTAATVGNAAQTKAAEAKAAAAEAARPDYRLAIEGEGLRLVAPGGSTRALPFGMPRAQLLTTLGPLRDSPEFGDNPECGAGPLQFAQWRDGLRVVFQDGKFAGWSIDKRGPTTLSTMDGLFVGATRADVVSGGTVAKIFQSTLGTEFTVGTIGGLLDGSGSAANVTDLWAGTTCMFR